jgi:hypothetical protein
LLLGIDAVVVMKDIAGASQEEALDALEWKRTSDRWRSTRWRNAGPSRPQKTAGGKAGCALLPGQRRQRKVRSAPELRSGLPLEASS